MKRPGGNERDEDHAVCIHDGDISYAAARRALPHFRHTDLRPQGLQRDRLNEAGAIAFRAARAREGLRLCARSERRRKGGRGRATA